MLDQRVEKESTTVQSVTRKFRFSLFIWEVSLDFLCLLGKFLSIFFVYLEVSKFLIGEKKFIQKVPGYQRQIHLSTQKYRVS